MDNEIRTKKRAEKNDSNKDIFHKLRDADRENVRNTSSNANEGVESAAPLGQALRYQIELLIC